MIELLSTFNHFFHSPTDFFSDTLSQTAALKQCNFPLLHHQNRRLLTILFLHTSIKFYTMHPILNTRISVLRRGQKSLKLSASMTWSDQNCPTKDVYFEMIFWLGNFATFRNISCKIHCLLEQLMQCNQSFGQPLNSYTYTVQPKGS